MKLRRTALALTLMALTMIPSFSPFGVQVLAKNDLTKAQIQQKFEQINSKYEIGQPFSKEDADFVKKYATPVNIKENSISPLSSETFDVSRYDSNNTVGGRMKGSVSASIGVITNSYSGDFTTTVLKGSVSSIKNELSHTAYGLIGSGGVGKVYSNTLSTTCKSSPCTLDEGENYSASVAYAYTSAKATLTYSNGSLGIVWPE
ncbi:hypothetical protein [Brevibacillus borstelensis]|uniref:hypothetical protein n=1 Tax=Brevibacillus borstelensis TaxID=45462 RepID=UPI0030C6313F